MKDEATELSKCVFNVQDAEYKYMQTPIIHKSSR